MTRKTIIDYSPENAPAGFRFELPGSIRPAKPLAQVSACTGGPGAGMKHQAAIPVAEGQGALFGQVMPISGEMEIEQTEIDLVPEIQQAIFGSMTDLEVEANEMRLNALFATEDAR